MRRFIAIRGPIRPLRCDRGTNFIGAKNEFEKVRTFLLKNNCDEFEFQLNVPSASHMGGVWERQIRTVRNVLRSLLDQHGDQLDDDSLRTLFYKVMTIVNSRPRSVSNLCDPLSPEILTPNHIVQMRQQRNTSQSNMMPVDIIILKEDDSPRNKWPLATVQDAYPSDDGLVRKIAWRMADTHLDKNGVRTKSQSILERPVHKCILLLPADL